MKIIKHIKHVFVHKFWVLYYCTMCGEFYRGLKHDFSKLSPTELFESIKYYTGHGSPLHAAKIANGYSRAYLHHIGRNDHHYEHWIDDFDYGGAGIRMPYHASVELVCDYIGAAKSYEKDNFTFENEYDWWLMKIHKSPKFIMHEQTKRFINSVLYLCMNNESKYYGSTNLQAQMSLNKFIHIKVLNKKTLKRIYDDITERGI